MRDGLTFYRSFHEALKQERDKEMRLAGYEAIIDYALYGTEPEGLQGVAAAAFILARPIIDSSNAASDAGRRGGAPKGNQNAKKTTENNLKQGGLFLENKGGCSTKTSNDNENENDNENIKEKNNKKEKQPRHQYGEYKNVLLSDEDMEKLKKQFPNDYQQRIDNLSFYMKQNHKTYHDHLATIRNWARMDAAKAKEAAAAQQANTKPFHRIEKADINFDELEKQLLAK